MRIVYRSFFIYLAVLTATWLFADKAFDLIMEYLGKRFYWFESNIGNDVLMSVLCICISVVLWLQPRKQSLSVYTSLRRNIVALVLAFIYVFASLQYRERFTAFYSIQWLAYADALMVWLAIWYFTPLLKVLGTKGIVEETKKQARLKGDEIHPVDELQRNNEAHAICEYILDDTNDYSTTLAVSVT